MKIIPCIIGLGYVGLPITLNLAKRFLTYGFDINNERIKNLKKKIDINNEFNKEKFKLFKKKFQVISAPLKNKQVFYEKNIFYSNSSEQFNIYIWKKKKKYII